MLDRRAMAEMIQDASVPDQNSDVVEQMFQKFDEDNSGGIDLAEFRVRVTNRAALTLSQPFAASSF